MDKRVALNCLARPEYAKYKDDAIFKQTEQTKL